MIDAPPAPPIIVIAQPEVLTEQERRVLRQLRLLRSAQKGAKLIIEYQGPALLLYVAAPAGKIE